MSKHCTLFSFLITGAVVATTAGVVTAVEAAAPAPTAAAAPRAEPAAVKKRVRAMVRALPVRAERRRGYDRDKFVHWVGQGAGCDTRDVVLYEEAVKKPEVGSDCSFSGGKWLSYYDGKTTKDPSTFDIDHLVALAEAWDSGARRWNGATRKRFANDLGDRRTLVAVTASSNRSKSDQDPQEWLPAKGRCRYVREWAAVKTRWSLSVDRREKRALSELAGSCENVWVRVQRAEIRLSS